MCANLTVILTARNKVREANIFSCSKEEEGVILELTKSDLLGNQEP